MKDTKDDMMAGMQLLLATLLSGNIVTQAGKEFPMLLLSCSYSSLPYYDIP